MWFGVGRWGRTVAAQPLQGLESEVSDGGNRPSLWDWTSIKTLDIEAQGDFSGWQCPVFNDTYHITAEGSHHCPHLHRDRATGAEPVGLSQTLPHTSLPLVDQSSSFHCNNPQPPV